MNIYIYIRTLFLIKKLVSKYKIGVKSKNLESFYENLCKIIKLEKGKNILTKYLK